MGIYFSILERIEKSFVLMEMKRRHNGTLILEVEERKTFGSKNVVVQNKSNTSKSKGM